MAKLGMYVGYNPANGMEEKQYYATHAEEYKNSY